MEQAWLSQQHVLLSLWAILECLQAAKQKAVPVQQPVKNPL
jgi:hypothetical protein